MSLQIGDGSQNLLRSLHQTEKRLGRTFARLATGKRIATAADDAAGLAISKRLEAVSRGLAQGERNLADGVSYAQTAEGSLQSQHDTLGRMRELTVQVQNGTLSDADRQTIQQEYDQLSASLDQTAQGVSFGGQPLLDGSASGASAPTFTDGSGGEITVDIAASDATSLGVQGLNVADPSTLEALDAATNQVSTTRSALGAAIGRIGHRSEASAVARENTEAARSRIEDADYAQELANLTRDRIIHEIQTSSLRVHGRQSSAVLDLLG